MGLLNNKRKSPWRKTLCGFTLIGAIVALAIVSILAGMAYPSYVESVRKAKRAEGRAALMQLMQQQERFYSQRNTYIRFSSSSTDIDEKRFKWFSAHDAKHSAYEIKAEACENETLQTCVMLTAMPGTDKVDSSYKDPVCKALTMTSTGIRTANNPDCWR